MGLTKKWLESERRGKRYCPECAGVDKRTRVDLAQDGQKLVDMMLASYAFERASSLIDIADEGLTGQIWICSTDADFVPLLVAIRRTGVGTVWIQPSHNDGYGYKETLSALGIQTYSLSSLLANEGE